MTNRKQSIFIALILSISMLIGATFFSNANEVPQNSEAFKGGSIDLVQNLNIHMYFSKSEVDALVNPTVAITYPDGSVDLSRTVASTPVGVDDEVVSCYIFTVECAVKDYDKPATVCIVGNGGETITASYSVKDYCDEYTDRFSDGEFSVIIEALIAYGDAAKVYFARGEDTENGILTNLEWVPEAIFSETVPEGITHRSATLLLESEMTIRHYFELDEERSIENYIFYVDIDNDGCCSASEILSPKSKTNAKGATVYYVDIEGITPKDIATAFTIGVIGKADGVEYKCTYGALTYLKRINKIDAPNNTKNLISALYSYSVAASEFEGPDFYEGD